MTRAALYAQLGLVDAPLPKGATCRGCSTCKGEERIAPASYAQARYVAEARLADIAADREDRLERVRGAAARSLQGARRPVLAWAREVAR